MVPHQARERVISMLIKASIAAVALMCAAVSMSSIDFRELYNEMYPVNGLKRDVLGLCHTARPTFIRAVRADRVNCYDSMPDSIDQAIGWVRTADRLAAMKAPTAIEMAERMLLTSMLPGHPGSPAPRHFTGYVAAPAAGHPCMASALAPLAGSSSLPLDEPNERLARRIAKGDGATFAVLGLAWGATRRDAPGEPALPVLPIEGAALVHDVGSLPSLEPPSANPAPPLQAACRTPA